MIVEKLGQTIDDGLLYHLENAGKRLRGYIIRDDDWNVTGWLLVDEQGKEAYYANYQELRDALDAMDVSGYLNGTRSVRQGTDEDTPDTGGEECPF